MRSLCPSLALVALLIAACGAEPPESTEAPIDQSQAPSARPTPTATVTMQVDLPYFESVEELAEAADAIVSAKVLNSGGAWDVPDLTSDDPRLNPFAGASVTPSPEAIPAMGVPITVYGMKITRSFAGPLQEGTTIEVEETGGIVDGVEYLVAGLVSMTTEVPDLLFLEEVDAGWYTTVGVAQGRFAAVDGGGYVSVNDPALEIGSAAELQRLAQLVGG